MYIFLFFCLVLHIGVGASNVLELLHDDHWACIQRYFNCHDLKTMTLVNQKFYTLFQQKIIPEGEIKESIDKSPLLSYFFKQDVHEGQGPFCSNLPEEFKKNFTLYHISALHWQNFIGSPLYFSYLKYIRGDEDCKSAKNTLEKYGDLCGFCLCRYNLADSKNITSSIVVFDADSIYCVDIPDVSTENMQEQFNTYRAMYEFDKNKKIILLFNNTHPAYISSSFKVLGEFFDLNKVCIVDVRHRNMEKIDTPEKLHVTLVPHAQIKLEDGMFYKFMKELRRIKNLDKTTQNQAFQVMMRLTDSEGFKIIHYLCEIKKVSGQSIQLYPFQVVFDLDKRGYGKNNQNYVSFPPTHRNLLKVLLKNILAAKKHNRLTNKVSIFLEKIVTVLDPRYFFSYLTTMEKNDDPVLKEATEKGLDSLLQWIRDARKKHIEKYGFNLHESIVNKIIKDILGIK